MAHSKLVKKKVVKKVDKAAPPQTPQEQFQFYWLNIEKYQKKIDKLKKNQADLFSDFQRELLPYEHDYMQAVYNKTARLLSFAEKKSLGKGDREDLFHWIDEELSRLRNYPFNSHLDIDKLSDQFFALNALHQKDEPPLEEQLDFVRDVLEERFSFVEELSDDELLDMMKDPNKMREKIEEYIQHHESDFFSDSDEQDEDESTPPTDSALDLNHLTQLYRKIAKVLHPDREQDSDEKEKKHHLMVILSQAKKDNDIWTILNMYHKYVDVSFNFDSQVIPAINALLKNRMEAIKNQLKEQEHDPSLSGMIWQELGAASQKTREKKIDQHRQNLLESIKIEKTQTAHLRSLTVLKECLRERYASEQYFFADIDIIDSFNRMRR
ncbi:hypothetical protein U1R68_14670 [Pectobacterium colocasium]|uniref:hypothetical protein n=1 Tax=Pectobacterium colocasium TaxID=2878098 RepID=UPI001CD212DA|nr:hypothetical protein [Pectobacterium colocasium]